MTLEMAAVAFDGAHTAERELSDLRMSRDDPWLEEVAELERHVGGRFSMKATSPAYDDENHVGSGMAIGGGTGLLLGMIGGPLGLVFWGAMGAMAGGAAGASSKESAFDPLVEQVRDVLPHNSSALILVAENTTAEKLVSAVGTHGRQVLRQDLTNEQAKQLTDAAVRI
jgi:uncharacterized membrane protein